MKLVSKYAIISVMKLANNNYISKSFHSKLLRELNNIDGCVAFKPTVSTLRYSPDIIIIWRGVLYAILIRSSKAYTKKTSEAQIEVLEKFKQAGARVAIFSDTQELSNFFINEIFNNE